MILVSWYYERKERKIGELNKAKEDAVETVKEWLGLSDDTKISK